MYRDYEDPIMLQKELEMKEEEFEFALEDARGRGDEDDEWIIGELAQDIEDLRARIRFAWEDQADDRYDACNEWAAL